MRQVCNSTYLIDRETNLSPKLDELAAILEELVRQNGRKVVIFSEWTTMTMLIVNGKPKNVPKMSMKSVPPPRVFTFLQEEVTPMITTEVFMDIIAMHRQGMSMRLIAKKLGIHRNTVKKHITGNRFPHYRKS